MQQKHILYLLQQPPYLSDRVFEAFDALLVAAAFEQRVSLLFRGAGVQLLLKDQQPTGQRSISKMLRSLATYEITDIYADADAMTRHGLTLDDCEIPAVLLAPGQLSALIDQQDVVLND